MVFIATFSVLSRQFRFGNGGDDSIEDVESPVALADRDGDARNLGSQDNRKVTGFDYENKGSFGRVNS